MFTFYVYVLCIFMSRYSSGMDGRTERPAEQERFRTTEALLLQLADCAVRVCVLGHFSNDRQFNTHHPSKGLQRTHTHTHSDRSGIFFVAPKMAQNVSDVYLVCLWECECVCANVCRCVREVVCECVRQLTFGREFVRDINEMNHDYDIDLLFIESGYIGL